MKKNEWDYVNSKISNEVTDDFVYQVIYETFKRREELEKRLSKLEEYINELDIKVIIENKPCNLRKTSIKYHIDKIIKGDD